MSNKCLYCYKTLDNGEIDFHQQCSLDFFGTKKPPVLAYSIDQMAELAKNIVERSIAVPGVQPKLSLSQISDELGNGNVGRLTVVGALDGNYILKPPSEDYQEMPEDEHLTMRIAEALGIPVVKSSLIRLQSGELCYITKRIDRTDAGEKIHMLDMYQIVEAFDKYKSSMEKIGKAIAEFSSNTLLDQSYFFELAVFSFLTGNNDMHLKNFSMINNGSDWVLSPAYDLLNVVLINPGDKEELALPIRGKKDRLKQYHFELFGADLGLNEKQIEGVFKRFLNDRRLALQWIKNSFLSDEFKEKYKLLLEERFLRISDIPVTKPEFPPYKFCKNPEEIKLRTWSIPVDDTFSILRLFNISLTPIELKNSLTLEITVDDGTNKTSREFPLFKLYQNPKLQDDLFFITEETKYIDIPLPKGRKKITGKIKTSSPLDFEIVLACEWIK